MLRDCAFFFSGIPVHLFPVFQLVVLSFSDTNNVPTKCFANTFSVTDWIWEVREK